MFKFVFIMVKIYNGKKLGNKVVKIMNSKTFYNKVNERSLYWGNHMVYDDKECFSCNEANKIGIRDTLYCPNTNKKILSKIRKTNVANPFFGLGSEYLKSHKCLQLTSAYFDGLGTWEGNVVRPEYSVRNDVRYLFENQIFTKENGVLGITISMRRHNVKKSGKSYDDYINAISDEIIECAKFNGYDLKRSTKPSFWGYDKKGLNIGLQNGTSMAFILFEC